MNPTIAGRLLGDVSAQDSAYTMQSIAELLAGKNIMELMYGLYAVAFSSMIIVNGKKLIKKEDGGDCSIKVTWVKLRVLLCALVSYVPVTLYILCAIANR